MQDFKKLTAWQKSHVVTLQMYAETANFHRSELFGLTSQMRRAASSIPANIAEGCCHGGEPTLARHLRIALGSAGELEYYIILAADLKFECGIEIHHTGDRSKTNHHWFIKAGDGRIQSELITDN